MGVDLGMWEQIGAFMMKAIDRNCLRRFVIRFAITKTSSKAKVLEYLCERFGRKGQLLMTEQSPGWYGNLSVHAVLRSFMVDCNTQVDIHTARATRIYIVGNTLVDLASSASLVSVLSTTAMHVKNMFSCCSTSNFHHAHKLGINTTKTQPLSQISQPPGTISYSRTPVAVSINTLAGIS